MCDNYDHSCRIATDIRHYLLSCKHYKKSTAICLKSSIFRVIYIGVFNLFLITHLHQYLYSMFILD